MELSELKTSKPRTKWRDRLVLLHNPRAFFVYCFITWGALLSPEFNLKWLLLSYIGFFGCLQLTAYRLDELKGGHCSCTTLSRREHILLAIVGMMIAGIVACLLAWRSTVYIFPIVIIGAFFIIAYNYEVWGGIFHNTWWFGLSWGALPIYGSYVLHSGDVIPSDAVIVAGATAIIIARLHIWSYGLTKCYHSHTCLDNTYHICHGMKCSNRIVMPKEVHKLAWNLINYQIIMIAGFTFTLVAWRFTI